MGIPLIAIGLILETIAFFVMPEAFPSTAGGGRVANIQILTYMIMQCVLGAALITAGILVLVGTKITGRLDEALSELRKIPSTLNGLSSDASTNNLNFGSLRRSPSRPHTAPAESSTQLQEWKPVEEWPERMRPVKEFANSRGWNIEFTGRSWLVARNGEAEFQEFFSAEEVRRAVGWTFQLKPM